ncbi:MAG: hypothetical protein V1926_02570 [Candidatus Peregrinibacteria bacterium]
MALDDIPKLYEHLGEHLLFPLEPSGAGYKGGIARAALKLHHLDLVRRGERGDGIDEDMLKRMLEAESPVSDAIMTIIKRLNEMPHELHT